MNAIAKIHLPEYEQDPTQFKEPKNPFDAFLIGAGFLTKKNQRQLVEDMGTNEFRISRIRNGREIALRANYLFFIAKLLGNNLENDQVNILWQASKDDVLGWVRIQPNENSYLVECARSRRGTVIPTALEIFEEELLLASYLPKNIDPLLRTALDTNRQFTLEKAFQRLYLLADILPETYLDRRQHLEEWARSFPSRYTTRPVSDISQLLHGIFIQSYIEIGLTLRRLADVCDVKTPSLLSFFGASPYRHTAIKYCSGLTKAGSRNAVLNSAADCVTKIRELHIHIEDFHSQDEAVAQVDESTTFLCRQFGNIWRTAAFEVIQRAVELDPRLEPTSIGTLASIKTPQPPDLSTDAYRMALSFVAQHFSEFAQEPLLPDHLHNKLGKNLHRHEITPQAKWLLELRIP